MNEAASVKSPFVLHYLFSPPFADICAGEMMAMAAPGVKIDANPLHRSDTWKLSLARLVFADSMTRMALLPPKAPGDSISILRKAFDALSRDQDFLQDAITAMRFQPRFEVGKARERLFQLASQIRPEVISFFA